MLPQTSLESLSHSRQLLHSNHNEQEDTDLFGPSVPSKSSVLFPDWLIERHAGCNFPPVDSNLQLFVLCVPTDGLAWLMIALFTTQTFFHLIYLQVVAHIERKNRPKSLRAIPK